MRASPYIFALFGAVLLVPGCEEDPDTLTGGRGRWAPYSGDPGSVESNGEPPAEDTVTLAPTEPAPPKDLTFAEKTLARAREWITVEMPYCGGPNGGQDVICGGTCDRDGETQRPEWDAYRSDCSGFVSWAWSLPSPGGTTRTLAPYSTKLSTLITVAELAPSDALNGSGHVMLWGGWIDEQAGTALILQESKCGQVAHEKPMTFKKIDATTLQSSDGRRFRPIRLKR